MKRGIFIIACLIGIGVPTSLVYSWVSSAEDRLHQSESSDSQTQVATAKSANEAYCTPELKQILRRVLQSCGLINASGGRGCQPLEAKNVATMSGTDFNALFLPMAQRAGIVQFDQDSSAMDFEDTNLVDQIFADQRGASYFLVVSRASPEGSTVHNRELSQQRAEAVLQHLQTKFQDPDLEKEVGLLWLGEEFAQLDQNFCTWKRSGQTCSDDELNRSAFMTWVDCRL